MSLLSVFGRDQLTTLLESELFSLLEDRKACKLDYDVMKLYREKSVVYSLTHYREVAKRVLFTIELEEVDEMVQIASIKIHAPLNVRDDKYPNVEVFKIRKEGEIERLLQRLSIINNLVF